GVQVILPAMPHLRPLVELLAWVDADRHSLTFDAASMRRAVSQSSSAQRVAHVLAELSGGPLPLDLVETLEQWEREADQLRLQHVLVLSSPDAGLLRELRRKRTLRRSFDGAISPHHLAVKPHQREQLHRKLRRRGYAVRDELPAQQAASASTSALDETTAAYLWLAVRVYRDLSAVVKQSVPVP